ncbi:MAG: hypothetical protein ABFD04_03800 [Syntrophomonas sp.]
MVVLVLMMGMSVFVFPARFMVMFMFMSIGLMGVLMIVHLPVMLVGMFMAKFGMSVLVLMRNTIHIYNLLSKLYFND